MAKLTNEIEFPDELIDHIASRVSGTVMKSFRNQIMKDSDEILGVPELSSYLGMSQRWIYDRVSEKSIPHFKMGSTLKFSRKNIDNWMESLQIPVVTNPPKTFMDSKK